MKVFIGATREGVELKNVIITYMEENHIDYEDVNPASNLDFVDISCLVAKNIQANLQNHRGILIDEYGAGSFMTSDKFKYVICAELNDEHSAKMTRDHNNANVIAIGSKVVGESVGLNIVKRFIHSEYAGGRHQIRVDMLNKMVVGD